LPSTSCFSFLSSSFSSWNMAVASAFSSCVFRNEKWKINHLNSASVQQGILTLMLFSSIWFSCSFLLFSRNSDNAITQ
jgi:hypothetical protein